MSRQILNLSFAGLYNNANVLNDQTINGGLLTADNIVIDQPNVAKSRRGFKKYNTQPDPIRSMATYNSNLLAFTDTDLLVDDGSGTYTSLSSSVKSPLPSKKFHYVESNKNFYFCDENGVYKLDSLSSTPKLAGVPQAIQISSFTAMAGTGTAVENNKQVAYRIVFGYKDANNNLILGAPSDRRIFQNTSGATKNVKGTAPIPKGVDTSFFFQVYRSTAVATTVEPDDELQLVIENPVPSGTEIEFEDTTPDSLLGAFLYTNETQEGITQSNYQPPLCTDVALYKNSVFYANTTNLSSLSSNLLGTSSTVLDPNDPSTIVAKNLQVGDTITIGTVVFTGVSSYTDPLNPGQEFIITDTSDIAFDIQQTIQSFIDAVNRTSTCKCYAYYASSDSDIPGSFTLQAKDKNEDEILVTSSKSDAFQPELNNLKTVAEKNKNRVYFSKPQQPEAVPVLNYIDVGSANYEIKRIVALRDSLFVLKTDGIYRISGESASSFTCKLFDGTTKIIASETAVAFNNMVYCVADQGIITISETGVSIISMPIENDLFELSEYANFSELSFAVAYGSDRKYILFVPSIPEDTTCTQAYIYNSYTSSFVRWTLSNSCGVVRPNEEKQGELFLGTIEGVTYKERKTFTLEDYCDDEYAVVITNSSPYQVVLQSIPSEVQVGFTLRQDRLSSVIEAIDTDTNTLTLSNNNIYEIYDPLESTDGKAVIYTPIRKTIEWYPITCNNPSFFKHFREITFMFLDARFRDLSFDVYTDSSPDKENTVIKATSLYAWGFGQWGAFAWGGDVGGRQAIRSYIPLEKSRCRWLDLSLNSNQAFTQFAVSGISLMYSVASERDTR